MPRANRYFVENQVWHLTHRCHEQSFLLKFVRDRDRYLHWLFEAKKRYRLCVLNYMVTCNHVHLLVKDTGDDVIPASMQLIAGRTGQEYNDRKRRKGAFWEDRYHATAVESEEHLQRCLVYIDLNMVRAGVAQHPQDWTHGGYREIQQPRRRYSLIDLAAVSALCGYTAVEPFQAAHRRWVTEALAAGSPMRDARWSTSIAIGSAAFVQSVQARLANTAVHRDIENDGDTHTLREQAAAYTPLFGGENSALSAENTLYWNQSS